MDPPAASARKSRAAAAPRGRGFRHAARLVEESVRAAGGKRGFAAARLLTHWDEVVGPETARLARPLRLNWGRGNRGSGLGATLTLATAGASAPLVQMLAPQILQRVNAALGYAAVARITLVQTAEAVGAMAHAGGFAEPQAGFAPSPRRMPDPPAEVGGVRDPALRAALEALGRNVLSRSQPAKGSP
jgi:hypothetical protein